MGFVKEIAMDIWLVEVLVMEKETVSEKWMVPQLAVQWVLSWDTLLVQQ